MCHHDKRLQIILRHGLDKERTEDNERTFILFISRRKDLEEHKNFPTFEGLSYRRFIN